MSGEDLVLAAQNGNFPEVVRYVDEEHMDVNSRTGVSFPFKKETSIIFFLCLRVNRVVKTLLS